MAKKKARAEGPARTQDLFARPPEGYRFATPEEARFINEQGSRMLLIQARMDTQTARIAQHTAQLELARRDSMGLLGELRGLQGEIALYNERKLGVKNLPGDIIERENGSIIICMDPKKRVDGRKAPPAVRLAPPSALAPAPGAAQGPQPIKDQEPEKKGGK